MNDSSVMFEHELAPTSPTTVYIAKLYAQLIVYGTVVNPNKREEDEAWRAAAIVVAVRPHAQIAVERSNPSLLLGGDCP